MPYKLYHYDAVVIGSGAAGYSAACRLREGSKLSVAIVTEGANCGTSRNTGSDKQTYYKLGLGGDHPDSVRTMAQDLFAGGAVDGDNALCEAALSSRCFLHLCQLGVPFPVNRYGEYIGYKTDHDPYARATSAGPLTSHYMTQALEAEAKRLEIPVLEPFLAVRILTDAQGVYGLLAYDTRQGIFALILCPQIILATGGPAGIYADTVYPEGHTGSTGLALDTGATLQNMAQWQFGLASTQPRWNVSGTYMQVLPRFVSVDSDGSEREFLLDHFASPTEALNMVFLKGYQWPFDVKKIPGSSVIDLLVHRETVLRGRKVYLDFTRNPFGLDEIPFDSLSQEARTYLQKADSCFGTPIQRLEKMNSPAIDLYAGKGLDLRSQYLPIALCAQHNNGGISVDLWWQTEIPGLFAAGECAGTHGITRPGGSALNAGQVGAFRAAQYICAHPRPRRNPQELMPAAMKALDQECRLQNSWLNAPDTVTARIETARRRMSDCAGAIRDPGAMEALLHTVRQELEDLPQTLGASFAHLPLVYKLRDLLTVQCAVLGAMLEHAGTIGSSQGSSLYTDSNGSCPEGLEALYRFRPTVDAVNEIQQVRLEGTRPILSRRPVRPLPQGEDFFETVWRQYRENQNIF